MSAGDKIFAGSIPENYDRYMVPLIFESYARDMCAKGLPHFRPKPCWKRRPVAAW